MPKIFKQHKRRYKGWIPSSRGRISYTRIGRCDEPYAAETVNYGDSKRRIVVTVQERNLGDYGIITNFFVKILFRLNIWPIGRIQPLNGNYFFLTIAQTKDNIPFGENSLRGFVFFFHKDFWSPLKSVVSKIQESLEDLQSNGDAIPRAFLNTLDGFTGFLMSFGVYAEYYLERNGTVTIELCSQNSTNWNRLDGIASQVFNFLKDIAHRHQHHNPHDDAIVGLYPMNNKSAWIHKTMQSIHGTILEARNTKSRLTVCIDALGIIEYSRAFYNLHVNKINHRFNDKTLSGSLRARIEKIIVERDGKYRSRTHFMYSLKLVGVVLTVGSFIIGIAFFGDLSDFWIALKKNNVPWLDNLRFWIIDISSNYLAETIAGFAILIILIWYMFFSILEEGFWVPKVSALSVAFRKKTMSIIVASTAVFFVLLSIKFFELMLIYL